MRILYINYIETDNLTSGSSVRPYRMLEAFKASGHEIMTLTGEQTKKTRKYEVKKMSRLIEVERPDICYIESPTHPIFRRCDRQLICKIHDMGIPIGYFYRDFYAKFRHEFPRRCNFLNYMKDVYWDLLLTVTDRLLNNCNIVYFPSMQCKELFDYKDMRNLPPAGVDNLPPKRDYNHTCIYVGGWDRPYDTSLLLDTFEELYKDNCSFRLIIVCREKEWKEFEHPCKEANWLEVYHVSGNDLKPLYSKASVGLIIPKKSLGYNQYAISVKTFEYIGYGLPVVSVNCSAISGIIKSEKIGLTAEPTCKDFGNAIKKILENEKIFEQYFCNVRQSLLSKNLWKHRVDKIVNDLSEYIEE